MTADPKSVNGARETKRFARLGFDKFRVLATAEGLSESEKIGFPNAFREGFDEPIWLDISAKLPALSVQGARILDVGSGCGPIARRLINNAEALAQHVLMVDHKEMLDQLPVSAAVSRIDGRFPHDMIGAEDEMRLGFDAILIYSVLQVVIVDANPFAFLDAAMALLSPGGRLLVGDIPNVSMLRRFLASDVGIAHHKAYMRTAQAPEVPAFVLPSDRLDDGLLVGIMLRARMAGYDAYLLPQPESLPLANRREDLLIARP